MPDYFDQGFSVRQPAWHGLATVLKDYPGREEAMRLAGHDFHIVQRPVAAVGDASHVEIPGWKALFRDDTEAPLGVVRDSYHVVQNKTLWDIADAIVSQENVRYETAGVLRGGATLWVLARLDEPVQVPGDDSPIYPYCLVGTHHDGAGACRASAVSVRVVCWNTFQAAQLESGQSGREYAFRHTKNVMDRIEDAKLALRGIRRAHADFMELANALAKRAVTEEGVREFLARFIPEPPADIVTIRVRRNIADARQQIRNLLDGPTIPPAHRRTAYGLFEAGIEYLDHLRSYRSAESYFNRCVFRPERLKRRLVELVQSVAA